MPALVQLNAVTSQIFTGIGQSAVPVLLPFDTAAFLDAQLNGASADLSVSHYQADFRPAELFDAGPAGYDAMFSLEPGAGDGMPQRTYAKPVEVQITGSMLTYDINDPLGGKGEPVKALAAQFPDLRRFIREGYVRYAFTRFGVPYVVSIQCLDSVPLTQRLACREAYPVAERFLKALHLAGGLPSRPRMDIPAGISERLAERSPDFTYRPSGDIIARQRISQSGVVMPTPPFTRKSDFRCRRPRPSPTPNPLRAAGPATEPARPTRSRIYQLSRGRIIFAKPAVSVSDNVPAALATRDRISVRRLVRRAAKAPIAAIPTSRASSPSAMAC